ncbi:tetratricopeptide repeat protein [Bacteroidota bacterium]
MKASLLILLHIVYVQAVSAQESLADGKTHSELANSGIAVSYVNQGIHWYNQRTSDAVGLKAKEEHINNAIPLFQKAIANPESELEAGIYLMRSYIFKARFVEEGNSNKRKTFQLAKELGDRLVPKYPNSSELRFEYISAIGQWGDAMDIFRAIKEGVVDMVKTQMEALIKLDPEFRNGIGERSLAVLNLRVPHIPWILSWPDKKNALVMLTKVFNKYPNDLGNTFYYAEALMKNNRKTEAKQYLLKALSIAPKEDTMLEDLSLHEQAREMLNKL